MLRLVVGQACSACEAEPVQHEWLRLYPSRGRFSVGARCGVGLSRQAGDHARDRIDLIRVFDEARRLGGEVWRGSRGVYWFPAGLGFRREVLVPPSRPTVPVLPKVRGVGRPR